MLIVAGLVAAMFFQEPAEKQGIDPTGCELPGGQARAVAFIELPDRVESRDTVVEARICLRMRDPKVRIGSYHGVVTWDSTKAKLVEVEKGRMGMRLENTTKPGVVDFAGAFPAGFDDRAALTLKLSLTKSGKLPPLTLHMYELNELGGTILTSLLQVTGYPSTVKTSPGVNRKDSAAVARNRAPAADSARKRLPAAVGTTSTASTVQITSVAPSQPTVGSEVVLRGKGFTPTGNLLQLGRIEIRDLPSADGGTLIRFALPTEMPAKGEVPPKAIGAGEYTVVVRNARGVSNTFRFTVRN